VARLPAEQAAYLQHMQTGCGHRGSHDGTKRPGREANHTSPHLAVIKDAWSCTNTFLCLCDARAKGQLYFTATYSQVSQGASRLCLPTAILSAIWSLPHVLYVQPISYLLIPSGWSRRQCFRY
jgi:hypothetical protein